MTPVCPGGQGEGRRGLQRGSATLGAGLGGQSGNPGGLGDEASALVPSPSKHNPSCVHRAYGVVSMCIGTGMGAAAVFEYPGN